jgi:transglycosylase-like protein with SLT domain
VASRPQTLAEIELAFERSRHRASARRRAPRERKPWFAWRSVRAAVLAVVRYLRLLLDRFGSVELALSAYNAGPAAVKRAGGAPTIATLRYVKNIEAREPSLLGC